MAVDNNVHNVNFRLEIHNDLYFDLKEVIARDKYKDLSSAEVHGLILYVAADHMNSWQYGD